MLARGINPTTRNHYSAEEKIRIVLVGLRGEESIAPLCRREGIAESQNYSWSKEFLEAGKNRLAGDAARQATSSEVKELRSGSAAVKEVVAELTFKNGLLKKKHDRGWKRRRILYPASEKLEIIRTVEASHLPVKQTLKMLGIPAAPIATGMPRGTTEASMPWLLVPCDPSQCGTASRTCYAKMFSILPLSMKT